MTELQLGKYEFENEIENKFLDAARKYLAEKEAKKKNTRKRKK